MLRRPHTHPPLPHGGRPSPDPVSWWEGMCIVAASVAGAVALLFIPELITKLLALLLRLFA